MGDLDLITRSVALLDLMDRPEQARRLLSEIVEFAPHDWHARTSYAEALAGRSRLLDACHQHATAASYTQRKPQSFSKIAALMQRRDAPLTELRECAVDAISNLPTARAAAVILTLDAANERAHLHVVEATGEQVTQWRTSRQGGQLYGAFYGRGPQIYELGSGTPGTYRVEIAPGYNHNKEHVSGKLTLLQHVGQPHQTRRDVSFSLPMNSHKERRQGRHLVATFTLTDRDRAGDASIVVSPR